MKRADKGGETGGQDGGRLEQNRQVWKDGSNLYKNANKSKYNDNTMKKLQPNKCFVLKKAKTDAYTQLKVMRYHAATGK